MKKIHVTKNLEIITIALMLLSVCTLSIMGVHAGSYDGNDLAIAILADPSTLISSQYTDSDKHGHRQEVVLSSLGVMQPTDGSTFALLSTGIAGANPATTNAENPGSERGTWFGRKYPGWWGKYDEAKLTLVLQVPEAMHYLYYDVKFFSTEYPEYVGAGYNDKLTITVDSPSEGTTSYVIDVDSGDFILSAEDIPGTGFDVFATSGNPGGVDTVTTTVGAGADAGATALVTRQHPVYPNEQITLTFDIKDKGDNQFDSAAFIDNVMFSGYGITNIQAQKTVQDLNGGSVEPGDTLRYSIIISNIGTIDQPDNIGNEFGDVIPDNTTYVSGSATSTSGIINYDSVENKIVWNGVIPGESSVKLTFDVAISSELEETTMISNQGIVYWDSNENGTNDAEELTDDPSVDDGVDQDGDGNTGDDDPTITTVYVYTFSTLTEDFSDDVPGGRANESYYELEWFNTSTCISSGSNFEVSPEYHFSTPHSFKTQLRMDNGFHYWNYTTYDDITWWKVNFTCGNNSEQSDLYLDFKNNNGNNIARIKFEYVHVGTNPPMDWVVELYYFDDAGSWQRLYSDLFGGHLFNGWYTLKVEKNGSTNIDYKLYRIGKGLVNIETDNQLTAHFSNLTQIVWSGTRNPVVCPMFFWDEHIIGFT